VWDDWRPPSSIGYLHQPQRLQKRVIANAFDHSSKLATRRYLYLDAVGPIAASVVTPANESKCFFARKFDPDKIWICHTAQTSNPTPLSFSEFPISSSLGSDIKRHSIGPTRVQILGDTEFHAVEETGVDLASALASTDGTAR
jgi:hypothetical protein